MLYWIILFGWYHSPLTRLASDVAQHTIFRLHDSKPNPDLTKPMDRK